MANTFYITAGLIAIDSADSPPSGDNKFFITAGLIANDYVAAGGIDSVGGVPIEDISSIGGVAIGSVGSIGGVDV